MVARMMRWRPWPPSASRKYRVRLVLRRADDLQQGRVRAEVRWKGPRPALGSLRRASGRRNCTREEEVTRDGGVASWDEEFDCVCALTGYRDGAFHPWEIVLQVVNVLNQAPKDKAPIVGTATLNLAEFMAAAEEEIAINLPLHSLSVAGEPCPSLHLTLSLLELRTFPESSGTLQMSVVPVPVSPLPDSIPSEKDELSAFRAGLRKFKILSEFVSARKAKKTSRDDEVSEGRCSARSGDTENTYPFDTDSLDGDADEELEKHMDDSTIRKSFSYGTLSSANYAGGSFNFDTMLTCDYEDWFYYSHRRSDVGCSGMDEVAHSVPKKPPMHTSKRSILPWKRRKFNLRSPKDKGEPLLNKAYGEEGGDDIDFDRRQLSSDESFFTGRHNEDMVGNRSSVSDFGDDNFEVGSWESKELISRDGHMKVSTQIFLASIDQRSERAAGESACTALVAVIADWLQANRDSMPIKSQFDSLIRDGSLEWRKLCENQTYRERFPDKHFDLETVLQAKIRPFCVDPGKSFIGFFHPEGANGNRGFDFLHGAMSFDNIWDEICQSGSVADGSSQLYIVSWNDHFFVLKVENDAYYIIDTLGERLYEGCNQAYILKFDESTSIHKIQSEDKPATCEAAGNGNNQPQQDNAAATDEEVVCRGKESCKEYIKSFLAAIPIRELQDDIKKGRMASTPLHHRLQIEFHYTEKSKEVNDTLSPQEDEVNVGKSLTEEFNPTPELEVV